VSDLPPLHQAVPLAAFRAAHGLDERFSLSAIAPKDFSGLGSTGGLTFADFWQPICEALQAHPTLESDAALQRAAQRAVEAFEAALNRLNARSQLTPEQAEFAVAGFADLLWQCVYALLSARRPVDLDACVAEAVAASLRRSSAYQMITVNGSEWRVCTVSTLFGRVGLLVEQGGQRWLVADSVYTCPMAQVMTRLVAAAARCLQTRWQPNAGRACSSADRSQQERA
jgi:hypothetical protein